MPMLDMVGAQRRAQQIGRIRIGQQVPGSNGRMRPAALATFRFTTGSQVTAEAIAEFYGGTARPWEGRRGQFEVITGKSEIWVNIPPRDAVVTQWYEKWGKSGIERRCDSQRLMSGQTCLCPHAEDPGDPAAVRDASILRAELAKRGKACARVTRINVMVPDLPGVGVFRLDTGSFHAAAETGDKSEILELARAAGLFLKARLRIEWRERGSDRKPYPVPVLEIMDTVRDIVNGRLAAGGIAAQLPPAPAAAPTAIEAPPVPPAPAPVPPPAGVRSLTPQEIADLAAIAETRDDIEQLIRDAERDDEDILDDLVCVDQDDTYVELREHLRQAWKRLPARKPGP